MNWIVLTPETMPIDGEYVMLALQDGEVPVIGFYSKSFGKFFSSTGGEYPVSIVTHWCVYRMPNE